MESNSALTVTQIISDWATSKNIFRRNRVPKEKKVVAAILCASGFSFRQASKLMGGLSYVAIHDAYVAMINALPKSGKKYRRCIAIDETQARINGHNAFFWLARDVDTGELLIFRCSLTGIPEDGAKFVGSVLQFCSNRPLVRVGRGPNYPRALKNLDLQFQIDTTPSNPNTIRQKIGKWIFGGNSP